MIIGKVCCWMVRHQAESQNQVRNFMKNILFVIGQMRNGGAERVTALLAGKLIEYNYRVGIIIYRSSETEYSIDPNLEQFRM